ncbi:UNVERIFIED_ORG: hypothetical protein ABIC54_003153 [Burkholderia sp. 1263]
MEFAPNATLFCPDATALVPIAIVFVLDALAFTPSATESVPLALVPPMPIAIESVPVAVPVAKLVLATKYGTTSVPVTVRLLIVALFRYAAVFA